MKSIDSIISTEGGFITGNMYHIPNRSFLPKGLSQISCDGKNYSLLGSNLDVIQGSSIGFSYQHALNASIGEFAERYCASFEPKDDFLFADYTTLKNTVKENILNPSEVCPYAEWQYNKKEFPYKKFTHSNKVTWVKGNVLSSNRSIWVPAFLTYLPHNSKLDLGEEFTLNTSTGVSAGKTLNDAIEGGLLECIERDAFCNFWYKQRDILNQVSLYNQQEIKSVYPHNDKIFRLFNNQNVKIFTYDLSLLSDVNTILIVLYYYYKNRKMISVGAASRFNMEDAITKAALEAYQGIEYGILLYNKESEWISNDSDFSNVNSFQKHFAFYNKFPELRVHVPMLNRLEDNTATNFSTGIVKNKITSLKELLSKSNYQVIYVDVTTRDVNDLDIKVVRVIVPNLTTLTGVHLYPFLGLPEFNNREKLFLEFPHLFP